MKRSLWAGGLAVLAISLLTSCSTTSMVNSWADPAYTGGKITSLLIIGVGKNAGVRRQFEDSFVKGLKARKVLATASYPLLPDPAAINEQAILPIVHDQNIKAVLVTRVVDKKTVTSYVPPTVTTTYAPAYPSYYYGGWYGYYGESYAMVSSPGYTYETDYVSVETNVYDVASNKLIWSGVTETEMGGTIQGHIEDLIAVLIGNMAQQKLI